MLEKGRRKTPLAFASLCVWVLLALSACGRLEVGIERTPLPTMVMLRDASSVTPTPPAQQELLQATLSALATQNAILATRVQAQPTQASDGTSAAAPLGTPTPASLESLGYPPHTRTGTQVVDAIIEAVLADDRTALRELVHYTVTGCTHELGLGTPPKCEAGQDEGTMVEVFPVLGPEGMFVRREHIASVFSTGSKTLYAVYRVPADAYQEDYWPAGDYGIVFLYHDQPGARAITFLADAEGIVRLIDHQSLARALELEYGVQVHEFILPPLAAQAATPTPFPSASETPTPPALAPISPQFWTRVGAAPDALAAILLPADVTTPRYGDIATLHLDGTHPLQLTNYRYNTDPVLSPDRLRVAYRSVPSSITSLDDPGPHLSQGYFNIWVITVDGEQAWQLTTSEIQRSVPVWSPDSDKVAFTTGPDGLLVEVEVDTQARREIVRGASAPRYRPDGDGIGYVTDQGGLVWIDTAGAIHTIVSGQTLPANTAVVDFDWVPDGAHVVYTLADRTQQVNPRLRIGIKYSVWIARVDGLDRVKLADGLHDGRVSPDGQIVATLAGSGYADACLVDQRLVFLRLAPDLSSAQRVDVEAFEEYPQTRGDGTFYPSSNLTWVSDRLALGQFNATCLAVPGAAGRYLVDPIEARLLQITRVIPAE